MKFVYEKYIVSIQNGDKNALKILYEDCHLAVYSLAHSILLDHHKAEDVTQEVFIKIWNNACHYRIGTNPKAWIMGITRNTSIDTFRKIKKEYLVDEIEDGPNITTDINLVSEKLDMESALKSLSDIERQIFVMHIIGDSSYLTISHVLKMPLSTVAYKGLRSIKKVRNSLGDYLYKEES